MLMEETWFIVINDLFFSALGFFLGVWFYSFFCLPRGDNDKSG